MQLLVVMAVRRAVRMVITMSPMRRKVFFVDSFIGLTPNPSLNREGSVYLGGFGF
jgi:hypothetical protein